MLTIADTLRPEHVVLRMEATEPAEAMGQLARLLQKDRRITNWDAFFASLTDQPVSRVSEKTDFAIYLAHARSEAVTEMVMSAARLSVPLLVPGCEKAVRYLFCIGMPHAVAAEYLRIAGALMRLFTDTALEEALRSAVSREEFVATLAKLEVRL